MELVPHSNPKSDKKRAPTRHAHWSIRPRPTSHQHSEIFSADLSAFAAIFAPSDDDLGDIGCCILGPARSGGINAVVHVSLYPDLAGTHNGLGPYGSGPEARDLEISPTGRQYPLRIEQA